MSGRKGLLMSDGPFWQRQRKFTHDRLQEFGFKKTSLESTILTEVKYFVQDLATTNGKQYEFSQILRTSIANVIYSITCGKHHEYSDPVFKKISSDLEYRKKIFLLINVLHSCFPWLKHMCLPFDELRQKKVKETHDYFRNYLMCIYLEHEKSRT